MLLLSWCFIKAKKSNKHTIFCDKIVCVYIYIYIKSHYTKGSHEFFQQTDEDEKKDILQVGFHSHFCLIRFCISPL